MLRFVTFAASLSLLAAGCHRAEPLVTAPKRALAGRLSYAALDRWRPLDDARQDNAARETVPLAAVARLSAAGDWHGVGAASIVSGDFGRATEALDRAAKSDDVAADRALVTLVRGNADEALEQLDAVLARAPKQPRALWNRALALQALELPLAAAQSFDAVAALGEPGWADEARARSAALEDAWKARIASTTADIAASKAMISGGALPTDAIVQRAPSMVRHYFYHAARSAPSLQRLEELRPLAVKLDAAFGDTTLATWIDRIAKEAPESRAALGPRYARYMLMPTAPPPVPAPEVADFFAAIAKAHADDLMLGALVLFNHTSPADLAQLHTLVARNGDSWWQAKLAQSEATAAAARGDVDRAVATLTPAVAACNQHHFDFRCADMEKQLAMFEQDRHHTSLARRWALASIASSRRAGMIPHFLETSTIFLLAQIARYRNDFSLMRAYSIEGMLRVPANCDGRRMSHLIFGVEDVFKLDFDAAAHELAETPACTHAAPLLAADLVTSLYLAGHDTPQAKTIAADVDAARKTMTPSQQRLADVILARLSLTNDRAAALTRLAPAMTPARAGLDADALKARTFAFQMLAVDAGRRGDFDEALDTLAREAESKAGQGCALGVALDDARLVVAARAAGGKAVGHYAVRTNPAIDAATLVPPAVRAALTACPEVAVYALAPLNGRPELLPPELAWSYRLGRAPEPAPATAAMNPPVAAPRVVITDVLPPATLSLPRLLPWTTRVAGVRTLAGADATPKRALAELADAGEIRAQRARLHRPRPVRYVAVGLVARRRRKLRAHGGRPRKAAAAQSTARRARRVQRRPRDALSARAVGVADGVHRGRCARGLRVVRGDPRRQGGHVLRRGARAHRRRRLARRRAARRAANLAA